MKKWSLTTKILVGVVTVGVIATSTWLIVSAVKKSGTRSDDKTKQDRSVQFTK